MSHACVSEYMQVDYKLWSMLKNGDEQSKHIHSLLYNNEYR